MENAEVLNKISASVSHTPPVRRELGERNLSHSNSGASLAQLCEAECVQVYQAATCKPGF